MSHELHKVLARVEGRIQEVTPFFSTKKEWHSPYTQHAVVDGALTWDEALKAAHADWEAEKQPLCLPNGIQVPDMVAICRRGLEDELKYLATVGTSYSILQYPQVGEIMGMLTGKANAVFETGGVLKHGRQFFLTAKLPGDIELAGGADKVSRYLTAFSSHDGSSAAKFWFTTTRTVCANTVRLALRDFGIKDGVSIRHSGDMDAKLKFIEHALGECERSFENTQVFFEKLRRYEMSADERQVFWDELVGARTDKLTENEAVNLMLRKAELELAVKHSPGADLAGETAFGVLNATTWWADHFVWDAHRPSADADRRFLATQTGGEQKLKQKAGRLLATAIKAAGV